MLKTKNIKYKRRLTAAIVAATAITAAIPYASSFAGGPSGRATFTNESPADYIVFNAITDNVVMGDERNFVRVREADSSQKFGDEVTIVPGKEYEVQIYFHNNAKSSLNTQIDQSTGASKGIAQGVRVSTGLSTWTINKSKSAKVSSTISALNSNPKEVWDEAYFKTQSEKDIVLHYVKASAKLHIDEKYAMNNAILSDEYLFNEKGVLIGLNKLDGNMPGCAEYSGYIIYRVRADQPGSTIKKTVSKDGKTFAKTVSARPGDTLTYKVEFENTGTLDLTNVTFRDKLPSNVELVPGTTYLTNLSHPNGVQMSDVIGKNGFNTGLYSAGAKATITYQVKVKSNLYDSMKCNASISLKNAIYADYNVGQSSETGESYDNSYVVVKRTCKNNDCTPGDPECPVPDCVPGDPECPNEDCVPGDPECPVPDCTPGDPDCPIPDPDCTPGDPECPIPTDECADDDLDCICKENPKDPRCGTTTNPPELPKTGPGEIALAIVAVVCISTGGIYWYRSQKDLAKVTGSLDKGPKASK